MTFAVEYTRVAVAYLRRLDRAAQERIKARVDRLSEDPFEGSKQLKGPDALRSARVGGWRIIYRVDVEDRLVVVVVIAPRGQVYRDL